MFGTGAVPVFCWVWLPYSSASGREARVSPFSFALSSLRFIILSLPPPYVSVFLYFRSSFMWLFFCFCFFLILSPSTSTFLARDVSSRERGRGDCVICKVGCFIARILPGRVRGPPAPSPTPTWLSSLVILRPLKISKELFVLFLLLHGRGSRVVCAYFFLCVCARCV